MAMAIIYYSETVRLRLAVEDFLGLVQMQPCPVDMVGSAYLDLHEEWQSTQVLSFLQERLICL